MANILAQLNTEMTDLVRRARGSVVQVSNGPGGAGAGTIWSSEGLVITNAHVVHQDRPRVSLSGAERRELPARVLAYDPDRDLALLSVEAHGLPVLPLRGAGPEGALRAGEWVFAIGHPWGIAGAVTGGVVIGGGTDMPEISGLDSRARRDWLMVGLVLRPGNSGGPLVDVDGRLVGVNTIMTGPAVGGAVPVHVVRQFLTEATRA
jgi:serine protease Do